MISGSAVSNVASVGPLTIPMMMRTGYSARDAGAIEAVGSTGGQIMPPVMGAAAFLMAEFLEIPYGKIALAAAIPAVLYYLALYWQVDLIAAKGKIALLKEEMPDPRKVMKDGWHFIIPFVFLIFMLFYYDSSPENAALSAATVIFVTGMIRGSFKAESERHAWRILVVDLGEDVFAQLHGSGTPYRSHHTSFVAGGDVSPKRG
jgi:TRAP-type uncharacterized transport system fused permease subunit